MSRGSMFLIAAAVAAPMVLLYAVTLYWLSQNPSYLPANAFETLVLGTQFVRLAVIMSVPRLRRSGVLALDIFSAEVLILPVLLVVSLLLGSKQYLPLTGDVMIVWGSAFLIVFPAYAIYAVSAMIRRGADLVSVIPSATSVFAVLVVLLAATTQSTSVVGLAGVTRLVLSAFLNGSGTTAGSPLVAGAGVSIYLGLLLYSTLGRGYAARGSEGPLLLSLLGAAIALGWGFSAGSMSSDTALVFGVPSIVLLAVVWFGTRER
jgi:hypothetical protein